MSDVVRLLDAYVQLAGGRIEVPEPGLLRFTCAAEDERWFGQGPRLLAFDIEHMDLHPTAEMAVVGSAFAEDLITAIRSRGARADKGFLAPSIQPEGDGGVPVDIPVRRGQLVERETEATWLPIGRLTTAASVRTGHEVKDHLVTTDVFDLTTGRPVPSELVASETLADHGDYRVHPIESIEGVLPGMLDDVEEALEPRVEEARKEAERRLEKELRRLDRYYERLIAEERRRPGGPDVGAIGTFEADRDRRKKEELSRNRASAVVRPVQVEVYYALAQRVRLTLQDGTAQGVFEGRRLLIGEPIWEAPCPACQENAPEAWAVCDHGHLVCSSCTDACTICGSTTCERHGGGVCSPGGHAVCSSHGEKCEGCGRLHCSEHAGICETGLHRACVSCLVECAVCEAPTCSAHSFKTVSKRGRESRTVCGGCVRYCRGNHGEVLAKDQVMTCSTCGQDVCADHRGHCQVDEKVHCISHLEKTDASRRLVCTQHLATCRSEPGVVFASDEVTACATCGEDVCRNHGEECYADGQVHCPEHHVTLPGGEHSCSEHSGVCVVDDALARIDRLERCPVCSNGACDNHRSACATCGRSVCANDLSGQECRTCINLKENHDPADELVDAFVALADEGWGRSTHWEEARDATHRVVRVSLSRWGRKFVFCWDNHTDQVTDAVFHGLIRTKKVR